MTTALPDLPTARWRASARLSVSGPEGWAPAERMAVHHRDGHALVTVESWPVDPEVDLEQLASAHAAQLAGPQRVPSPLVEATVLGHPDGRGCTVSWSDAHGQVLTASLGYALRPGRMFAVTQVAPEGDPARGSEMASILASVTISTAAEIDEQTLPLLCDAGPGLAAVAEAWRRGASASETIETVEHLLTTEECFGAARHYGVAMLPGSGSPAWHLLDDAQRELASAVAWRSLQARGVQDDPALCEALELAAGHDLLVVITAHVSSEPRTQWYAIRTDRMVRVRPGDMPGTLRLACFDTASLADLVLAGGSDPGSEVTAFCVHRRDGRVVGREVTWRADARDAEVRSALVGLLPTLDVEGDL